MYFNKLSKNGFILNVLKLPLVLFVTVLFAWYVSDNFFQLMLIQGDSMVPSYYNFQLVVLDKFSKNYEKGNVIAFKCEDLSAVLVKRIVGCPCDTVQIIDGTLFLNGEPSVYYYDTYFEYEGVLKNPILLNENEYVVIGDNVLESIDSRYDSVGIISSNSIVGKIVP